MPSKVRKNAYYNDPLIGAAFDNLAGAFKVPTGSDVYGYAHAASEKAKAGRLSELFAYAKDPTYNREMADRLGVGAGVFNPNQSYYSVDQGNVTSRRNTDATNATSIANNKANNEGALARQYAQPITVNENQTVRLPAQTAAATGLPAMFAGQTSVNQGETIRPADGSGPIQGTAKPLSDSEVKGGFLRSLSANEQRAVALQGVPVETVMRPDNTAEIVMRPDAVGRNPVLADDKKTKPQLTNYKLPDAQGKPGMSGTAVYDAEAGGYRDTQTKELLPQGITTYSATLTGDKAGTGLGPTTANTTASVNRKAELTRTANTLDLYEGLIRQNPATVGIPGLVRGTAQNAVAVANDVAKAFGKDVAQVQDAANAVRTGLKKVAPDFFDPAIPEAQFYQGTLAYALARTENPSGEVSRQAFDRSLERVRGGMLTNPDQILSTIGAFRKVLQTEMDAIGVLNDPAKVRTDPAYQAPAGGPRVIQTPAGQVTIKRREP